LKSYTPLYIDGDKVRGERREVKYLFSNAKVNLTNNFSPYYFKRHKKIPKLINFEYFLRIIYTIKLFIKRGKS